MYGNEKQNIHKALNEELVKKFRKNGTMPPHQSQPQVIRPKTQVILSKEPLFMSQAQTQIVPQLMIKPKPPPKPTNIKPVHSRITLITVAENDYNEWLDSEWSDDDSDTEVSIPAEPKRKTREENIADRIQELQTTEESYVQKLERGFTMYIESLRDDDNISDEYKEKFQIVSKLIENVLNFHKLHFLPSLEKCNKNANQIAQVFLKLIDNLSVNNKFYSHVLYAMSKLKMSAIVDEKFDHFKELAVENDDKLGIRSFLMEPIQRMFKYKNLMEDIVRELHKMSVNAEKNVDLPDTLRSCTLAVYWIGRVLDNTNEAAKLDTIDFGTETENINISNFGMLMKGGELRMSSPTKPSFDGNLFVFEKAILITRPSKKCIPPFTELSQGIFEWKHLIFSIDNHEPDRGTKEITLTHRENEDIRFKLRKADGSNIYDFAKILHTYIMEDQRMSVISTISTGQSKIAEITEAIFKTANIVITETDHLRLMATNRRAYIKSFCLATQQLNDFIESLDYIMNFHKDILFVSLEKCRGDTKKVINVLQKSFSEGNLDMYRKYSIEAGKAIHKFQTYEITQHKRATMSFSEFVMLPVKRLQVYSHTLEVFCKKVFESEDSNVDLLKAAATLNKKLKTMRTTLLDFLQISTISKLQYGEIIYTDILENVELNENKKVPKKDYYKIIMMEEGLVCVKYKIITEDNTEIMEIISHRCMFDLKVCTKQTSKRSSTSVYFQQRAFPKIKFLTTEKKNIFLEKFKQQILKSVE